MANVVEEHFLARPTTSKVGTELKIDYDADDSGDHDDNLDDYGLLLDTLFKFDHISDS